MKQCVELQREIGGGWPNWSRVEQSARQNFTRECTLDREATMNHRAQRHAVHRAPSVGAVAAAAAERDDPRALNELNDTSRYVDKPRTGPFVASDLEEQLAKDTDKREKYRKIYNKNLIRWKSETKYKG